MKKILISAVALVFGVSAVNAQSPWFLGGELGFGHISNATVEGFNVSGKLTTFSINPQVGYMLNDNWGVMLDLGFGLSKFKPEGGDASDATIFGVGVGAIYKYQIVDKFFYAPTVRVGYERWDEAELNNIGADLNFLRFEMRPACHWGINFNFGGLSYLNSKPKGGDAVNAFDLNVGDAMAVGFTYYF